MKVFDQFFTKFAYKFDKGYPDMDNPNDVALLESFIWQLTKEKYSRRSFNKIVRHNHTRHFDNNYIPSRTEALLSIIIGML